MAGTSLLDVFDGLPGTSGVPAAIADQVAKIGDLQSAVSGLTEGSSDQIGGMVSGLQGLGLPDVGGIQGILDAVDQITHAIPSDPSQLIGPVTGALADVTGPVNDELIAPLTEAVAAAQAIAGLMEHLGVAGAGGPPHGMPAPAVSRRRRRAPGASGSAGAKAVASAAKALPGSDALAPILAIVQAAGPITMDSALPALAAFLDALPEELFPGARIPGLTRFRQTLHTVLAWGSLDAAGLTASFADTLRGFASFVTASVGGPAQTSASIAKSLDGSIPFDDLNGAASEVLQELAALASAVGGGDLSTSTDRISHVGDRWSHVQALLTPMSGGALTTASDALVASIAAIPTAMEQGALRVLAASGGSEVPSGGGAPPHAKPKGAPSEAPDLSAEIASIVAAVKGMLDPVQALLDALDIGAIRDPLQKVVDEVDAAAAKVKDATSAVRDQVSGLLDTLDPLIDQLDLTPISSAIHDAIAPLPQAITDQVGALFDPVKAGLGSAVDAVDGAVGAINLSVVRDTLKGLAEQIAELPANPSVGDAIATVKQALQEGVDAIGSLSFAPVADEVIADINGVKDKLATIDPSQIPDPVREAVKAALKVLPSSFGPIEDGINQKFDELMRQGPKQLLDAVKDGPATAKRAIEGFSPASLVGDALSKPFQDLLAPIETFKPSNLLAPVEDALGSTLDRLKSLHPGAILDPLTDAFASVLAAIRTLDPSELIKPLTDAIGGAIDDVVAAVPVDAIFEPIDAALDGVRRVGDPIRTLHGLIQGAAGFLDALADPAGQVTALTDALMAKLGQVTDLADVKPALQAVRDAVDGLASDRLLRPLDDELAGLSGRLASLDPAGLATRLRHAAESFPTAALGKLPASPERDALRGFVDGFDPSKPATATALAALASLRTETDAARARIPTAIVGFEHRYLGPNGVLAAVVPASLTPTALRSAVRSALERELAGPLAFLAVIATQARSLFDGVNAALGAFLAALESKAETLAVVPDTVRQIQAALNDLVGTLHGLDPGFIATSLHDKFQAVVAKVEVLDPATVQAQIEQAFQQVVDAISPQALLPTDQIHTLDDRFAQIVDGLKALDPTSIVVDVEPDFDAALQPVEALLDDLGVAIAALIDKLDALEAELKDELDRTAQAFEAMLQAVPV